MWMAPASYYDDNSNGALSADADRADLLARLLVPLLPASSYNFIPSTYI